MKLLTVCLMLILVAGLALWSQEPPPVPRYLAWVLDPSVPEASGANHPTTVVLWLNALDATKSFAVRIILESGGEYLHPHQAFRETGWHLIVMRLGSGDKVSDVQVTELTPGEPVPAVLIR